MQELHSGRPVGRVIGLWRYPVKSMGGEPLAEVSVSWQGLAGDRRWAFVREGLTQSSFPWLTLRERADMSHYMPSFADPADPEHSPVLVRTPSGAIHDVMDAALAQQLWPGGARVMRQQRGVFDTFPLSLITTASIESLGARLDARLDVERFRPNILVEAAEQTPFVEDRWVGRELRMGGMRMRIDKRSGRCAVITIEPSTPVGNPLILRTVVREREGCLGVYGSTVLPGRIALGDPVLLE
jgi:uncharacterized protein